MSLRKYISLILLLLLSYSAHSQEIPAISGQWRLVPASSSLILYRTASLDIKFAEADIEIIQQWGNRYATVDSMRVSLDGKETTVEVGDRLWPTSVFMGVSMIPSSIKEVSAEWIEPGKVLKVESKYPVLISQGRTMVYTTETYTLSDDGTSLSLTVERKSRPGEGLKYVFRREDAQTAYYMELEDNWEIDGKLPQNAFLISLQGIVNTDKPNLYFLYPESWDFAFTKPLFRFYKKELGYAFKKLTSPQAALKQFKKHIHGYIVWDPEVRTSLDVAFTLAGLRKAVVVSPDMVPMMKNAGLKEVEDFSGRFAGMNDAEIFKWAYEKYWDACNHKYIIWMGGVSGDKMQPGIADFGVARGAFFVDLSTRPSDTAEYALADKILGSMEPLSMVMGWHSYAKDLEREYVTLTSQHALRVEGLNTFPNLSFTSITPPSPGFSYENNHNLVPGKEYVPEKKIYIACLQTDGLGLGAWHKPGRGSIPYAYEVTMNMLWMNPVFLEYFYSTATDNDLFIGALSGPGYMYPKQIPEEYLPDMIKLAADYMDSLDLNIFETMDYSEGSTVVGNTELPKDIVKAYYKYMPEAIGFVNGYAPAYTFWSHKGRPFVSFDYYLDEDRSIERVVDDLKELAQLNKKRPYFLLIHVREWNSIERVKTILDKLGPEYEVVPLDIFLKMAGNEPTFTSRFLDKEE